MLIDVSRCYALSTLDMPSRETAASLPPSSTLVFDTSTRGSSYFSAYLDVRPQAPETSLVHLDL